MLRYATFALAVIAGSLAAAICGQGELAIGLLSGLFFSPLAFFTVGCYACACTLAGCLIGQDLFDGDLSQFTVESGAPTVSGGSLLTASGDVLTFNLEPGSLDDPVHLKASVLRVSGTPAEIHLIVGRKDANTYLFGALKIDGTTGTIWPGRRSGGVDSELDEPVILQDDAELAADRHELTVCLIPGVDQEQTSGFVQTVLLFALHESSNITLEVEAPDDIPADIGIVSGTPESATATFAGYVQPGSAIGNISFGIRARRAGASGAITVQVSATIGTKTQLSSTFTLTTTYLDDLGYSGANFGVTYQDINDGPITVTATFTQTGGLPDIVSLDFVGITIAFTSPPKSPARLTVNYRNTEAGLIQPVQCITAEIPGLELEGKKTGVKDASGSWDTADYYLNYHKSISRPPCPSCSDECEDDGNGGDGGGGGGGGGAGDCLECCDPAFPRAPAYTLDLGNGGWSEDNDGVPCGDLRPCRDATGVIVVRPHVGLACTYSYIRRYDCSPTKDKELNVFLQLIYDGVGCFWRGTVFVVSIPSGYAYGGCGTVAFYRSAYLASTADCQTVPATLTKYYQFSGGVYGPYACCYGYLPDTIELGLP